MTAWLFTNEATEAAEKLIEAVAVLADAGLDLALPSGTPAHRHNVTKLWNRLDQVFLSDHSDNILISCDTQHQENPICFLLLFHAFSCFFQKKQKKYEKAQSSTF